jgi:tetratricopeptide (TPR) repeat protein
VESPRPLELPDPAPPQVKWPPEPHPMAPSTPAPSDPSGSTTTPAAEPGSPASSTGAADAPEPVATAPETASHDADLARAAKVAIDSGDYAGAKEKLDELMARPDVERARELLSAQRFDEALEHLDGAVKRIPQRAELVELLAEACLAAGRAHSDSMLLARSLSTFEQLPDKPAAWFGSSRAARAMGRADDALRRARAGWAATGSGLFAARATPPWSESAERTLAEACALVYRSAPAEPAAAKAALLTETEDALSRVMARSADDAWAWRELAELYLGAGRPYDALQAAERGLDKHPESAELANTVARAGRSVEQGRGLFDAFSRFRERHPQAALGQWYPAYERLSLVIAGRYSNPDEVQLELDRAKRGFEACRALDSRYIASCLEHEALCRGAQGWALLARDPAAAQRAFLSMEDVETGGLRRGLEGRLRSGVEGLIAVAELWHRAGDRFREAAAYDALHAYEPDELAWARAAAVANSEAAQEYLTQAEQFEQARRGEIRDPDRLARVRGLAGVRSRDFDTERERERFARKAADRRKLASDLFEKSYQAYLAAVQLAPTDVRILNDAAKIAITYLKRDADRAEEMLQSAIRIGTPQLENKSLDDTARFDLATAIGDAHQNLGVLYLELRHDPVSARASLEKSLEVSRAPRPYVTEELLPRCKAAIEAGHGNAPVR